jgi:hypothetical protein
MVELVKSSLGPSVEIKSAKKQNQKYWNDFFAKKLAFFSNTRVIIPFCII